MGWIFSSGGKTIEPAFGDAPFISSGQGVDPELALDGAGNIDGAALIGGSASGQRSSSYALESPTQPTLLAGTTVLLLCGRQNNWLPDGNGGLLPVEASATWSVTKPGEWGMSLVSRTSLSPFAVVSEGQWVYANAPPKPPGFEAFGSVSAFPPPSTNAPVCVWAFYDTTIHGSQTSPAISVAWDDGAASEPVRLNFPVTNWSQPLQVPSGVLGADVGTLFVWQGIAAGQLFQQPVRAAYWNDGLRTSIASQFRTAAWSNLSVTELKPQPIALGGDAQDNVSAQIYQSCVRTSPFAHYSVTTSAGTPFLAVRYELCNAAESPESYSVSFQLDGHYLGYDQPWRDSSNYRVIPLPQDGRSHTLDLRNGYTRGNSDYANPTSGTFGGGGFIDAVAVPKDSSVSVNHPAARSVAMVLSHSVATGDEAGANPWLGQGAQSSVAWPVLARAAQAFGTASVVDESFAGELLALNCLTQSDCNAYIAALKAAQPHITVGFLSRMSNDFYHGRGAYGECLPQYRQTLGNLFRAWAAALPGVPLYVGSDIRESAGNEALTDGCPTPLKLADWRGGIESAVQDYVRATGSDWLHFVDMTPWVPQSDLASSGLHPTVKGQVEICQAVAALFNRQVTCTVPQ
jgi:hypothetical protein